MATAPKRYFRTVIGHSKVMIRILSSLVISNDNLPQRI